MAVYMQGFRTANFIVGQPCLELITSSTNRATILEIGYTLNGATTSEIGIGFSTVPSVSPVTSLFQALDTGSPASQTAGALSWTSPPAMPTTFYRRAYLNGTAGYGIVWHMPFGIIMPVNSSFCIWNINTTAAADVWVTIDEQGS